MSDVPRFLLDDGVLQMMVNADSSFGQEMRDGRLMMYVDYRRGVPQQVQLVRVATTVSFKVHLSTESA